MKKNRYFIGALMMALLIFLAACDNSSETANNIPTPSNIPGAHFKKFPDRKYVRSVASSVLKFSCNAYSHGKIEDSWSSHCCLYSNKDGWSYLALPRHCFPFDSTKRYEAWVTDSKGRTIKLSLVTELHSNEYDAAILVVKRIKGLRTLCEREMISSQQISGDSAILLVPFNARDVYQKPGLLLDGPKVEMSTLRCEPGDSGGLIVGRDGVIGVEVSGSNYGKIMHFVPISVFEDIYGTLVNKFGK